MNYTSFYRAISLAIICMALTTHSVFAQTQTYRGGVHLGQYIHGYWEYLPQSYSSAPPNQKFPVIVFLNGTGTAGDGSVQSMKDEEIPIRAYGPSWRIINDAAFPKSFTNPQGQTFEFVVIVPQPTVELYLLPGNVLAQVINDMLDTLIKNNKIDPNRIYLAGQSAGPAYELSYLGASLGNANRIAAAMLASPVWSLHEPLQGANVSQGKVPIWFAYAEADTGKVSDGSKRVNVADSVRRSVNTINGANPPPVYPPLVTALTPAQGSSHSSGANYLFNQRNTLNGMNVYEWALQYDKAAILPVTGLSFSAKLSDGSVLLQWSTQSEQNSSSFTIERSADSKVFNDIATIPSKNAINGSSYSFTDDHPLPGASYYRIRHNDMDKHYSYSRVVAVQNKATTLLQIYPNPASSKLTIETPSLNGKTGRIAIYTNDGKLFHEIRTNGARKQTIDITAFPRGVYSGKISLPDEEINFQFIKR